MQLYKLKSSNLITSILSSSTNTLYKKLTRNYMKIIDNDMYNCLQNFKEESFKAFDEKCVKLTSRLKEEMQLLRTNFEEVGEIFTDELMM